jgi:hypothetical protein
MREGISFHLDVGGRGGYEVMVQCIIIRCRPPAEREGWKYSPGKVFLLRERVVKQWHESSQAVKRRTT